MSDDRNKEQSRGGFDDWLGDAPGPATDPYKALAPDVDDEDIEAWAESAGGEVTGGGGGGASDASGNEITGEVDAVGDGVDGVAGDGVDDVVDDDEVVGDVTGEVDAVDLPSLEEDDTGELHIVSGGPGEVDGGAPDSVEDPKDGALREEDATDEMEDVQTVGFGQLWDEPEDTLTGETSVGGRPEVFDVAHTGYELTATREHADLAESVALAGDMETQQVALAAPIPGLDPTVVGFEDVVAAEGHRRVRSRGSSDLLVRSVTGIVLAAALGASMIWRPAFVVLVLVVFVLGAGEFYTALVRSGRKPIAFFGFLGIVGAFLGAFFFGALAIPVAFFLAISALLLFYAVVPNRIDPLGNIALTVAVMVWAGLGSFTMLIARSDSYRTLILGIVVVVVLMDIAQYFFGRALGKHKLAPWVSPKKTVEGLAAGVFVAFVAGSLLHFFEPFDLTTGLAIGAVVAVFSPLGDLAMSASKRALGLKDMGSVLPGHGGFLDRIDGLIFVIPAAWAVFFWAGIL